MHKNIASQAAWKLPTIILLIGALAVTPILIFMNYPSALTHSTQIFSFFIGCALLNLIIPDQSIPHDSQTKKRCIANYLKVFAWIVFTECFIFILSQNFSVFAFILPGQINDRFFALPNWPAWLGIWAYFSVTITLQHYAYYHLRQVSISSGLCFTFKNTYFDIAFKRALGIIHLCVNFTGIYLLLINIIFIIAGYFQTHALEKFSIYAILFSGLFFSLTACIHRPRIKTLLNRLAFSNIFYLLIASICCVAAILMSALLSQKFPLIGFFNHVAFEKISSYKLNATPFLFIAIFALVTPFFSSIIVKHSSQISRKKLLLISFCLPNLFYLILLKKEYIDLLNTLNNQLFFILMGITCLFVFLRGKTTAAYITGALPLIKQRAILPASSYLLFPANCLMLFNLYLLAVIIGPLCLYGITVSVSLLGAILGAIGIISYFGKTYRLNRCAVSLPPTFK